MSARNSVERNSDHGNVDDAASIVISKSAAPIEPFSEDKKFFESDAGDGTKREDMYLEGKELFFCLLSVYFCLFLFALDQTIIATLLSTVGNKFNGFDRIGWLASGFLISMAVFVAVWGKMAIIFGRKNTMIAAIVLFEAGSLMCALANDMNVLIGGRVLAGVGGGGILTSVFIVITEILPIQKRPLGMALIASVFAVASVLGPLVGGAFTSNVSWRWCFYINLPIGGVALVLFVWTFNPPQSKAKTIEKLKMIDYFGILLLTAGFVIFLVGLTLGGRQYAWNSGAVIALLVIGGVFSIAYFVWTFVWAPHPMIPWSLVKVYQTSAAAVALFGMFGYFISTVIYLSVYFQVIHNASAWRSGVDLLPEIISVVVASMFSGVLVRKTTLVKPFAVLGGTLGFIGCGLITLLEVDSTSSQKIGYLIPLGAGVGMQMQACLIAGQITAPKFAGGVILATTLINFARSLGGALAATLADAVYTSSFVNSIGPALAKQPQSIQDELAGYDLLALVNSTEALKHMSTGAKAFVKTQVLHAIRNTFYMNMGFAGIGAIAIVFMTNKRLPTETVQDRDDNKETTTEQERDNERETTTEEPSRELNSSDSTRISSVEPVESREK